MLDNVTDLMVITRAPANPKPHFQLFQSYSCAGCRQGKESSEATGS